MNANITPYEREHNVNQRDKQAQVDRQTKEVKISEWPFSLFTKPKQVDYAISSNFA